MHINNNLAEVKSKRKNMVKNAGILKELLLKEFLVKMQEYKVLLSNPRSFELDKELDVYYGFDYKFITRLETILDRRDVKEISYLENKLLSNEDENSKLLSRMLELYLYTKMR